MLDLSYLGLTNLGPVHHNPSTPRLYVEAIKRGEADVAHLGPLVVNTGTYTDWIPDETLIVREPLADDEVWWGPVNRPIEPSQFEQVLDGVRSYLAGRELFVQDCYAGADAEHRIKVRVITELAWHSLFARNMLLRELDRTVLDQFAPDYTILHCPEFRVDLADCDGRAVIAVDLDRRLAVIAGTGYAGEIKKAIFVVMNYLLPPRGVLALHASANIGPRGEVALFAGPTGSGKTTLATQAESPLIADDALGWSDQGVFNLEGGCHAKVIRLSDEAEPEIFETTRRFGTLLENVTLDPNTHRVDLHRGSIENTRSAYPITHLDNIVDGSAGGHPRQIFLLAADTSGVLPPIARLTPEQAMYYFISGYTGDPGVGEGEPVATFSACFGASLLPRHPAVYAALLGKKLMEHHVTAWLVNTGWTGGPVGTGDRFPIAQSRALIAAAVSYAMTGPTRDFLKDPVFGFCVPRKCRGFPTERLTPRRMWDDPAAYDTAARRLAGRFVANFAPFADHVAPEIAEAGPILD